MSDDILKLQETVAHLARMVEDLSDVVARQEEEISVLNRRMQMVMTREAEREVADGGTAPIGDQRPPHW
ncbi:MAG: SlyX family protein [Paracoccaceae bacterium]